MAHVYGLLIQNSDAEQLVKFSGNAAHYISYCSSHRHTRDSSSLYHITDTDLLCVEILHLENT